MQWIKVQVQEVTLKKPRQYLPEETGFEYSLTALGAEHIAANKTDRYPCHRVTYEFYNLTRLYLVDSENAPRGRIQLTLEQHGFELHGST